MNPNLFLDESSCSMVGFFAGKSISENGLKMVTGGVSSKKKYEQYALESISMSQQSSQFMYNTVMSDRVNQHLHAELIGDKLLPCFYEERFRFGTSFNLSRTEKQHPIRFRMFVVLRVPNNDNVQADIVRPVVQFAARFVDHPQQLIASVSGRRNVAMDGSEDMFTFRVVFNNSVTFEQQLRFVECLREYIPSRRIHSKESYIYEEDKSFKLRASMVDMSFVDTDNVKAGFRWQLDFSPNVAVCPTCRAEDPMFLTCGTCEHYRRFMSTNCFTPMFQMNARGQERQNHVDLPVLLLRGGRDDLAFAVPNEFYRPTIVRELNGEDVTTLELKCVILSLIASQLDVPCLQSNVLGNIYRNKRGFHFYIMNSTTCFVCRQQGLSNIKMDVRPAHVICTFACAKCYHQPFPEELTHRARYAKILRSARTAKMSYTIENRAMFKRIEAALRPAEKVVKVTRINVQDIPNLPKRKDVRNTRKRGRGFRTILDAFASFQPRKKTKAWDD